MRDGRSPVELLVPLLRHADFLLALGALGGITGIVATALLPPHYRVTASFIPETSNETSSLSGGGLLSIATRSGFLEALPASSPDFYAYMLRTRTVLDAVVLKKYPSVRSDNPRDSVSLLEVFGTRPTQTAARRLEAAAKELSDRLRVNIDQNSGIIEVSVDMPTARLGVAVLQAMLAQLDSFNVFTRQSSAKSRREFLSRRVGEARAELDSVEDALERFYASNRVVTSSPSLTFQETKLRRRLEMAENVYLSLSQQLENARIDAVRDTPTLTVVERPIAPTKPSWPRRTVFALLGFAFGIFFGTVRVAWRHSISLQSPIRMSFTKVRDALKELARRWYRSGKRDAPERETAPPRPSSR